MEKQIIAPNAPNMASLTSSAVQELEETTVEKLKETIVADSPASTGVLLPEERVPANWVITLVEDGIVTVINCRNNVTGATFTGTPKEFSAFIRG
jgi:hypothetical protein